MSVPFAKDQMFLELREILFTQASQIALVRHADVAGEFLGVNVDDWSSNPLADDLSKINLQHFHIASILDIAYDFAFQTGAYWRFGGDEDFDLAAFGLGVTPASFEGARSPYLSEGSKVRHVVDMANARRSLTEDWDISIRGLALLAGMTEPAVRNSLSKEGIATSGKPAKVTADTALKWLQERRSFIPTRLAESKTQNRAEYVNFQLGHYSFPEALSQIIAGIPGLEIEQLAAAADFKLDVLQKLMGGEDVCMDIPSLQRLARELDVDGPHFVGVAIEHGLRVGHTVPTKGR